MATATSEKMEKTYYPTIPSVTWWTLRQKFKERPPTVVSSSYLSSVLNVTEKAAGNYIPQLRRMGLINDEGKLEDLAYQWRDDAQYKEACEKIVQRVYPQTLLDVYHSPDAPRDGVERWFANATRKGESHARQFARVYLMLLDGDPSKAELPTAVKAAKPAKTAGSGTTRSRTRNSVAAQSLREAPSSGSSEHRADANSIQPDIDVHRPTLSRGRAAPAFTPSIHLDFNIHIASDSSAELVDQIFGSIAKHLRSLVEASE